MCVRKDVENNEIIDSPKKNLNTENPLENVSSSDSMSRTLDKSKQ